MEFDELFLWYFGILAATVAGIVDFIKISFGQLIIIMSESMEYVPRNYF